MHDESIESVAVVQGDGLASLVGTVAMLILSAGSLRSAFRAAFDPRRETLARCRRWAIVSAVVVVAWLALPWRPAVNPEVPILVAIAVVDCWLVMGHGPRSTLPRATVRRRVSIA